MDLRRYDSEAALHIEGFTDTDGQEMVPLRGINDNYPKTVMTLDRFTLGNYEGIEVVNAGQISDQTKCSRYRTIPARIFLYGRGFKICHYTPKELVSLLVFTKGTLFRGTDDCVLASEKKTVPGRG